MQTCNRLLRIRTAVLLCGMITAAAWPAVVVAQGVPKELVQAWRRRQESVQSARFTFASDGEERQGQSTPFVAYRIPNVFVLSGDKWRRESQVLDGREFVSTFDGRQGMRTFGGSQVGILREPVNSDIRYLNLRPLVQWLRPLEPSFHGGVDLSGCDLISHHEIVDGRPCIRLRAPPEGANLRQFLFVDPSRDYVVVRCASEVHERPSTQIDITYTQDLDVGWVPSAWNTVWWFGTGEVKSRYSSTVESYSIKEKLSEKLFVIDFQPGTLVIDQATDTTYRIGENGEQQIVPRQVPRAATKPAFPLPSASELKNAQLWTDRMARGGLFVVIGALIVLGMAAVVRIRRRSA